MAKAVTLIALALGVLAMAGHVQGYFPVDNPKLREVVGTLFCATCIANSETDLQSMGFDKWNMTPPVQKTTTLGPLAVVEVTCKSRNTGAVTVKVPGFVGDWGFFRIYLEHRHEDDLCMVRVVSSNHPLCNVKVRGLRSARIDFKRKDPVAESLFNQPFGFVNKKSLPYCPKVRGKRGNMIPTVVLPDGSWRP